LDHRRLTWVLLPAVFLLAGLAASLSIRMWSPHLQASGLAADQVAEFMGRASAVMGPIAILAALCGGVIGLAVGPYPVLLFGAVLLAGGLGTVSLLDGTATLIPMAVARLGWALTQIGIWTCAAVPLAGRREPLRNGLFILLWGVLNATFLMTASIEARLLPHLDSTVLLALGAVLALLAAALATPLLFSWLQTRRGSSPLPGDTASWRPVGQGGPEEPGGADPVILVHLAAGGLIALCFLPWASHVHLYRLVGDAARSLGVGGIMGVNQLAVVCFGVLLPIVFWLQARRDAYAPALVLVGLGLLVSLVGAVLLTLDPLRSSVAGVTTVLIVLTIAELLIGPLILSRLAGDSHWRLGCLLVGTWLATDRVLPLAAVSSILDETGLREHPFVMPITLEVIGALVGAGLLIAALPLQRWIYGPAAEALEIRPDGS
jgi:hypothetical protein